MGEAVTDEVERDSPEALLSSSLAAEPFVLPPAHPLPICVQIARLLSRESACTKALMTFAQFSVVDCTSISHL